jgi:hypothetical protein
VSNVAPAAMWPDLSLTWNDTRDTLHLWTQVVGKVRLALMPMINHWWQVPLYVSARGLTTSLMHTGGRGLEIEFDFVDHALALRTTDGASGLVTLEPRSVASFYAATLAALDELDVHLTLYGRPSEVVEAIPFAEDEVHGSYDAGAAQRFWLALVQSHRVLMQFRAGFTGKASPVHFFWGGADLCTTRFSGRPAPKHRGGVPNCPDWVQVMAYSHEVSSCGYWPGFGNEGAFYAYAYPVPEGFSDWRVEPAAALYDADSANSCCRMRPCAPRRIPTQRCFRSSKAPTRRLRCSAPGIVTPSRCGHDFAERADRRTQTRCSARSSIHQPT